MNYADWYTDTVDVYRVTKTKTGNLTKQGRRKVLSDIPCRVYLSNDRAITMKQTAADVKQTAKLACDNSVPIMTGDELIITRGGRLGRKDGQIRAFAGTPNYYYEPFGAVIPQLAHQEIILMEEERVK